MPHWNQDNKLYFITFRLADSLPEAKLAGWREERTAWLSAHPQPWTEQTEAEYFEKFDCRINDWLDAGHGSCVLRRPEIRKIVADAILFFDGKRYDVQALVVMPNHVHVLCRLASGQMLCDVLHSWKSFTAKAVQKLIGDSGPFWQKESWDRLVRSEAHFVRLVRYIVDNPKGTGIPVYLNGEAASRRFTGSNDVSGEAASRRFPGPAKRQDAASPLVTPIIHNKVKL